MQAKQSRFMRRLQAYIAYASIVIGVVITVLFGWNAISGQFTLENWWPAVLGPLMVCSALPFLPHRNVDRVNSTTEPGSKD